MTERRLMLLEIVWAIYGRVLMAERGIVDARKVHH